MLSHSCKAILPSVSCNVHHSAYDSRYIPWDLGGQSLGTTAEDNGWSAAFYGYNSSKRLIAACKQLKHYGLIRSLRRAIHKDNSRYQIPLHLQPLVRIAIPR